MVPQSTTDVFNATTQTGTGEKPAKTAGEATRVAPTAQVTNSVSTPLVRQQLYHIGLSSDTTDILLASLRKTTGKQYNTYLSRWYYIVKNTTWTLHRRLGLGYSAINTARSALSSVIMLGHNTTFGEHPLVTRFLKGIFELKPSLPRYSVIWDVGTVLKYLQSLPGIKESTLK